MIPVPVGEVPEIGTGGGGARFEVGWELGIGADGGPGVGSVTVRVTVIAKADIVGLVERLAATAARGVCSCQCGDWC